MKVFVFNKALGLDLSPFAVNRKESATAAAIIGGIGLAGSLYSQYKSLESQADANKTNLQISRENNKANYDLWREQLAAQRAQYRDEVAENRYLTDLAYQRSRYTNQVQDMRAAGINPAFALDSGSFGQLSTQVGNNPSSSVPTPSPNEAARVNPIDYEGLGIAFQNSANFLADNIAREKEQDRADDALKSDKSYKAYSSMTNFVNALTEAKKAGVNEKYINNQIEDMERRYWLEVDKNSVEKENQSRQLAIEERTNEIRQYEADTARMAAKAGIALTSAQISNIAQEISESKERVFQMAQNGASQRSIDAYIERQQRATAETLERENERGKRQNYKGIRQEYLDFTDWLFSPLKGIVSVGVR